MIRVVSVDVVDNSKLAIRFSDGSAGVADLRSQMHGALAALGDPVVFAKAFVEDGTVKWSDDLDLSPSFLFALAHQLEPPKTHAEALGHELAVSLRELRNMAGRTQAETAEAMEAGQGEVSKIESRGDIKLSTLERYVRALGFELELVARKGDRSVRVRGFLDALEEPAT